MHWTRIFFLILLFKSLNAYAHGSDTSSNYVKVYSREHVERMMKGVSSSEFQELIKDLYDLPSKEQANYVASRFHQAMLLGLDYRKEKSIQKKKKTEKKMMSFLEEANKFLAENSKYHFDYEKVAKLNLEMLTTSDPNKRIHLEAESYGLIFNNPDITCFKQAALFGHMDRENRKVNLLKLTPENEAALAEASHERFIKGKNFQSCKL